MCVQDPRRIFLVSALGVATVLALCASEARAQFNVQWAGFENESSRRLLSATGLGLTDPEEKDYAWGDVDNDGDLDLVVARKQPFTSPGRKPNVLFINEDGALVDRTAQYASETDVPGDQGFLTPTNDRDVVLADLNGDGWLDIATAVTLSDGLPKPISHPRIYINKGAPQGTWLGFRFEQDRSPQLYGLLPSGQPDFSKPTPGRFCAIAAGDADLDGDLDLYLADYDSGGGNEIDTNDRLWINDGNGFFTDSYQTRMTSQMLNSGFAASSAIADMNGDGVGDVVRQQAGSVSIDYNLPPNTVPFDLFDTPHSFSSYFVSVGDLNNDDKLDMVVSEDADDRYRLNQGNDPLGRVQWSPAFTFSFPAGAGYGDDSVAGDSIIRDLDGDGWKDVLISDVDVDIPGCSRRMHIYHNLGGAPGGNVTLREEAQQAGSGGWKGAVGLLASDLTGTFNVTAFDIDMDGDEDLVIGRCSGTSVFMNTRNPCPITRYGSALPNSTGQPGRVYTLGTGDLSNQKLVLSVRNLPPGTSGRFLLSGASTPCTPSGDGLRCVGRERWGQLPTITASAEGVARFPVDFQTTQFDVPPGAFRYLQFRYDDPAGAQGFNWSEPVKVRFCE
jgi:hypothetical protein